MANEIMERAALKLDFNNAEIVKKLQATVARGTSPEEFWLFAQRCEMTGLNPLNNEIWCIKTEGYTNRKGEYVEGRLQIMTGINGFLATANSYPEFDGLSCQANLDEHGKPVSATATVWRKDRKFPHVCTAYFSEYYRPGYNGKPSNWDKMPVTMIEKVAKSRALREAFPQKLNDLYIPEELEALEKETPEVEQKHYYDLSIIEDDEKRALAEEKCVSSGFEKVSKLIYCAPGSVGALSRCEISKEKALGIPLHADDLPGEYAQTEVKVMPQAKDDHLSRVRARIQKQQGTAV